MLRYVSACEHATWHLEIENLQTAEFRLVPFKCRSWRHAGECAFWKASQDFCRIRDALTTRKDWIFATLTHDQSAWYQWEKQYTESVKMWSKMRQRLQYYHGPMQYIQTWERHRKKGIHAHLVIGNESIHACCQHDAWAWKKEVFEPQAVACGFGYVSHIETMRKGTDGCLANYLVKLGEELIGAAGKCQLPYDAPPHFRRLRASRGLLPPIEKSSWTGQIVFTPLDNKGASDERDSEKHESRTESGT